MSVAFVWLLVSSIVPTSDSFGSHSFPSWTAQQVLLRSPPSPTGCRSRVLFLFKRGGKNRNQKEDDFEDLEEEEDDLTTLLPIDQKQQQSQQAASPLLQDTSRMLRRVSFFSWWSQVILTSVSAVILAFARNAGRLTNASTANALPTGSSGFFLSGVGLVVSGVSILWTWGNGARLSRRLTRRPVSPVAAAHMLRRAVRVGVTLNLVGLLVHLLAAEQIVGTLAVKVLTVVSRPGIMFSSGAVVEGLQPLDVLIVQANTNSLLAHFCSLSALLFLTGTVAKLDPPSTETTAMDGVRQRSSAR
jgi:hypothetical protein